MFQQDLLGVSHFRGFLFYPTSSLSAASTPLLLPSLLPALDYRSRLSHYLASPMISAPPAGGAGLKYLAPDENTEPRSDHQTKVAETERSPDETQTRR